MFITNEAHRAALLGIFAGKGDSYWRVVEKVLLKPWYLVTLKQIETERSATVDSNDGFEFTRSILISELCDLMALLDLANDATYSQTLESVMVVTPGHVNGTADWQMDRLAAIWRVANQGDDVAQNLLLETAEGRHYPTSPIDDTVAKHCDLDLVYSLPAPRL